MSSPVVSVRWLTDVDASTVEQVHRVVSAVVEQGGAVGWLRAPTIGEVETWLNGWVSASVGGRAGLALAVVEDRIEGLGAWQAAPDGPVGHVVDLTKIMAHPCVRGSGLGRYITEALADAARASGAELLVLGVRGNNHGARALYEACGFTVWGSLPNGVAVDNRRFDDVRMYRQLSLPADAVIHGSDPGGIGGSVERGTTR